MTEPAGRAQGASCVPGATRSDCYDPGCTGCPRLAEFLAEGRGKFPQYWSRPVKQMTRVRLADPRDVFAVAGVDKTF